MQRLVPRTSQKPPATPAAPFTTDPKPLAPGAESGERRLVPRTPSTAPRNRKRCYIFNRYAQSGKQQHESGRKLPSIHLPPAHMQQLIILAAGQPPWATRFSWPGQLQPANEAGTSCPGNLSPKAVMPVAREEQQSRQPRHSVLRTVPQAAPFFEYKKTRTLRHTEKEAPASHGRQPPPSASGKCSRSQNATA